MTHLQSQLRVLSINEGEVLDSNLFRLEKGKLNVVLQTY